MDAIPREARDYLLPNRERFAEDPFGYSALAWHRWGLFREISGFPVDLEKPPSSDDLKSPILWLAHAHALSEAAVALIRTEPEFTSMPEFARGVCDSQYCAVGLMLVGYSLETSLKAMLILTKGVEAYAQEEKSHFHHRLEELAAFVPDLSAKDKAILRLLSQFVTWAGRYPDPGSGREANHEEVFRSAEAHEVTARDVFSLSARVMRHAHHVIG